MKDLAIVEGSELEAPATAEIAKVERFYAIRFPADYVAFLARHNGAIPVHQSFEAGGHEWYLERFLFIAERSLLDTLGDLVFCEMDVVTTQLAERLNYDEDHPGIVLVPIAQLFGGDYLCLDFHDTPDSPSVSVWLHEESDYCSPGTVHVADSFGEFLGMLY